MAAVSVKSKKKISAASKSAPKIDLEGKAARYRELEATLEKHAKKIIDAEKEFSDLKKELVAYANENRGDDEELEISVPGQKPVKIGKRGTSREITDLEKAKKLMGTETFMKVAKIGLTDLDKYLTPEQVAQVIKVERNDTRRVS